MSLINVVSACAGRVQTMNHVAGVDVGQSLGRDDLDVDPIGAAEMVLKVPLASFSYMDVRYLAGLSF